MTVEFIEDEDKAVSAKRLQEQCFFIYNFDGFAKSNRRKKYKYFVPIGGSPTEIVQKLLAIPNLQGLMSIKPYLLSSLVPQIRIYKVHYQTEGSDGVPIEMPFEDHLDVTMLSKITASGQQRGMGVGLKSFEWELLGTNPAESDNNIKAKLKLHFNTLEDFVTPRGRHEPTDTDVSYMNLIVPVRKFEVDKSKQCGEKGQEGERNYNNKYFRLKVSVGYGTPMGSIWEDQAQGGTLLKAIDNARQFFYLTLISHSLDFKEDGSLDLEVEYAAAMEGALVHKKADVLQVGMNAMLEAKAAIRQMGRAADAKAVSAENERNCRKGTEDSDAREAQEENEEGRAEEEAKDRAVLYNAILTALEDAGGIYTIRVKASDLGELAGNQIDTANIDQQLPRTVWTADMVRQGRKRVKGETMEGLRDSIDEAIADADDAATTFTNDPPESDETDLHYFHFGDLLNVAFSVLYKKEAPDSLKELKIITGPYVYFNPQTGRLSDDYGMCDIPISLNLFQVWFMDMVVKPQRTAYKLKQFVKDAVTGLVGAAMKPECFGKDYGTAPASLSLQLIEAPAQTNGKCRITNTNPDAEIGGVRATLSSIKPYPDAIKAETAKAYSYLFMYVASSGAKGFGPPQGGLSREERDAKLGTYHLRIGSDSGLMKKVKFKKSDQPYAREARMEKEGELDGDSLREKYDADVEMFGNAIFKPGTHVYIDPTTVGAGDPTRIETIARRMGLGGYFMVTNVKSSIESGKFQTDLKTVWVASGSGKVPKDVCGGDEECQEAGPNSPAS